MRPNERRYRGLYAITERSLTPGEELMVAVEQAIRGGVVMVQYRDKGADYDRRLAEALALAGLCRSYGVPLIVNDDPTLALEAGADGVHIGREDGAFEKARAIVGSGKIVGVSCYNLLELAIEAEQRGADYVAFGSFYPSDTKPDAVRARPELLQQARAQLRIPLVAIGGITPENARPLVTAGADMVAVITGLFRGPDILEAARHYTRCFVSNGQTSLEGTASNP